MHWNELTKRAGWRGLALLAVLLGLRMTAAAQVVGQNASGESAGQYTLAVNSKLVIETVSANDKQGHPIRGLTAKDFVVTEDGASQQVKICEFQELPTEAAPATKLSSDQVTVYNRLAVMKIAPEHVGHPKYRDKRLIAMYFDLTSMPPEDKLRALYAAEKFIRTQMTSADSVALMRYGGASVDVLQDFTDNRTRLLSILETLVVGENQQAEDTSSGDDSSDTGAAFGQDNSEFNLFNTDRQLAALQTAAKMLGSLSEKKVLMYFASGLTLNGTDNQAQLHATINDAIRSGVAFWPVDARGLVASAPLGDATHGSPGGTAMYSGASEQAATTRFQQSQDTLYALAGDTGGKALLDNNDLSRGIVAAQQSLTSYYVLGYYTTHTEMDGRFRHVKIALADGRPSTLEYRQGYYAGKVFAKFTTADKERQLEDALMLGDPITELTIAMELNYFQLNHAEYFVPVVVKIPGNELALAKKHGAQHTLIDFIMEVKDDLGGGMTVQNARDNVDVKLSDQTAAELAKRPIEYESGFTLLPGKYTVKFLARDDETGRIGTFETKLVIPNLNRVSAHQVAISTVVLSGERVDLRDVIYNAGSRKQEAKNAAANPLVLQGEKLVPSVTRVFSKHRPLYVYLQAYEPGITPLRPLLTYVSFYQGATKVFETRAMEVKDSETNSVRSMPVQFTVGLESLPPGEYICQVTVLDPDGARASFWQTPISVMP
jgi:VWFA-related protein